MWQALGSVTDELGGEHPRAEVLKAALAALRRSHHFFDAAQRLFEY
jgi:hypothetical protein